MENNFFSIVGLLVMGSVLAGCGDGTGGDNGITVPVLTVTSSSINSSGRLLTVTANGGGNQSPQLSWNAISDAGCYAIFMVDETAECWLHWRAVVTAINLVQGETISGSEYKGPYPPHAYDHNYRIEVFALKQAPGTSIGTFDNENNYTTMVNQLNAVGGGDNIVGRGYIIGKYKNGDNNI
jgi:phosphatidylethanolamine-binding protein (PEBP) family uncharacterized protein